MNRRGFVLLAALWFMVAISTLIGAGLGFGGTALRATRNRILLSKAAWARDACVEIARSRFHDWAVRFQKKPGDPNEVLSALTLDSVALSDAVWCEVRASDQTARLDMNSADSMALACVVSDTSLVRRLLRSRPFPAVAAAIRQLSADSSAAARMMELLTTGGTGQVNLNTASPQVLACLPGFSIETARFLLAARTAGRRLQLPADALSMLPSLLKTLLASNYLAFSSVAVVAPTRLMLSVIGFAGRLRIESSATVIAAPGQEELQILQRETE